MDEYSNWLKVCESLQYKEVNFYYKEREIWWCHIGKNIGNEIDGKHKLFERPVLILNKINKSLCIGLPLTSKFNFENYKLPIGIINNEHSFVLIEQFRVMSSKRLISRVCILDKKVFSNIKAIIKNLI